MRTDRVGLPSAAGLPPPRPEQVATQTPSGVELLGFAQTLCASSSHEDFRRRLLVGLRQLFDLPMCGLYTVDPWTGDAQCVSAMGVSDAFLARYERGGRELNWLQDRLDATGHAVYNMALMTMEEWLRNPLYTKLKYLHDIRHEVQAPVGNRDGVIGTLHIGTADPDRGITPYEVQLTEALGRVIGTVIEGLDSRLDAQRERDQAVLALDRTGTAVVITDAADPEPRPNAAAQLMLAEVLDAERHLNRVITRPGVDWSFSRHVNVELVGGGTGLLHGYSNRTNGDTATMITVLELQRDQAEIGAETLAALTPREREVALLVVDGSSDRQIAQRLYLSPHTVSQYVKRIYRKLDVSSRVALTRLLVEPRAAQRRH
ncbi:MAG TPA: helix-turn-helix transcriptional regulator [Actinomycetes bacterium]|nr:helix-turn-helix transcriptional regulator [Actinomycetes bacterium]